MDGWSCVYTADEFGGPEYRYKDVLKEITEPHQERGLRYMKGQEIFAAGHRPM